MSNIKLMLFSLSLLSSESKFSHRKSTFDTGTIIANLLLNMGGTGGINNLIYLLPPPDVLHILFGSQT